MNFVRAETLVQEITADGKVRDIVTQVKKSEAEKAAEAKEEVVRNLPEFKRDRGEGQSAGEKKKSEEDNAALAEEEAKEAKKYRVYTMDEDEVEHYQILKDAEREKKRKQQSEDSEAKAAFDNERKRLKEDGEEERPDLLSAMRQQNIEKAEKRNKAVPTAANRLKGKITVKAKTGSAEAAPASTGKPAQPASGGLGGLAGYGSDSDDE